MNVTPPVKRLSRAEQREQTRAALLDSAIELMVERGIDGTSIEDVVARAGYTRGAFYSNFASKHELIQVAFERYYAQMQAAANATPLPVAGDIGELEATFRGRMARLRESLGSAPSVLLAEMALHGIRNDEAKPTLAALHQQQLLPAAEYARHVLAVSGGAGAELAPEELATIWQALMFGLDLKARVDPSVDAERLLGRAMALLLVGLAAEEAAAG